MLLVGDEIDVTTGSLYLNHNSKNDVILVDKEGYVGIGTSSPGAKLHVERPATGNVIVAKRTDAKSELKLMRSRNGRRKSRL